MPTSKPDVSNYEWMGELEQELFISVSLLKNPDEVRDFFVDLLTAEEIQNISKRWCAARLVFDGVKHEEIKTRCKTSKATVSRANRVIAKFGTGMCQRLHRRLQGLLKED